MKPHNCFSLNMKHILSLCAILLFGLGAQFSANASNLILFTESGDDFSLWIDGLQVGNYPSNHFKVLEVPAGNHMIRMSWANPRYRAFESNITINAETEATYALSWDSRRNYSLIFVSEINQHYNVQPPATLSVVTCPMIPASTQTQTPPVTQTQTPAGNPNVFMPGEVVVPLGDPSGNPTTTTTTTTTIITTNEPQVVVQPIPEPVVLPPNPLPGYNGRIGCDGGLVNNDINDITQSLKKQTFESTRVTLAKQIIRSRCLLVSQVIAILNEFTFESNKLDLAKFAYDYTYDRDNYFKVNDAFTFSSSIDDLAKYIDSRR